MDEHRLIDSTTVHLFSTPSPFSFFDFVDDHYPDDPENNAIRRLFSIARSHEIKTLMVEKIQATGIIASENDEIRSYYPDHQMEDLQRISFWKTSFGQSNSSDCNAANCIGYAILKHDVVSSISYNRWHTFEAVIEKYPHPHNCVPLPMQYHVTLGGHNLTMEGLLYAQQNMLNKCCAHVALRSIISRIIGHDVSYRQMNDFAKSVSPATFRPTDGLNVLQIRAILTGFNINFLDVDYEKSIKSLRYSHPYKKFIYAGIESGAGALLGFKLTSRGIKKGDSHIIPFYGHTFNKDTWAPEADIAYFHVGEKVGYIPSENWTSSFLGHDDNFGPNFCIPRLFIKPYQVDYVVELLSPGVKYSGTQAEALSVYYLYSVLHDISFPTGNKWLDRLVVEARSKDQRIILRAISVDKNTYIHHLSSKSDWFGNVESSRLVEIFREHLPEHLWVVEISLPQLFPAKARKLGDIVLDASGKIPKKMNFSNFVLARLPSFYYLYSPSKGKPSFISIPSDVSSHLPCLDLT